MTEAINIQEIKDRIQRFLPALFRWLPAEADRKVGGFTFRRASYDNNMYVFTADGRLMLCVYVLLDLNEHAPVCSIERLTQNWSCLSRLAQVLQQMFVLDELAGIQ